MHTQICRVNGDSIVAEVEASKVSLIIDAMKDTIPYIFRLARIQPAVASR